MALACSREQQVSNTQYKRKISLPAKAAAVVIIRFPLGTAGTDQCYRTVTVPLAS